MEDNKFDTWLKEQRAYIPEIEECPSVTIKVHRQGLIGWICRLFNNSYGWEDMKLPDCLMQKLEISLREE